jgi:hypothetical protein
MRRMIMVGPRCLGHRRRGSSKLRLLIKTGQVDINLKDNDGRTPPSWAEAATRDQLRKVHIDSDANDNSGRTRCLGQYKMGTRQ